MHLHGVGGGRYHVKAMVENGPTLRKGTMLIGLIGLMGPIGPIKAAEPNLARLTRDGSFKQHLQWSPDGKRLLMTRIHHGKNIKRLTSEVAADNNPC